MAEFPALRRTIDRARLRTMAEKVRAAEGAAPGQPHPQADVHPVRNLVAGPHVAPADRARHAIEGSRRR